MAHSEATSGDGGALKGPSLTSAGCAVPIATSCASDRRVAGEERALAGRGDGTRRVLCFACGDGDRCSVPELVCICALTVRASPVNPLRLTRSNRPVKAGPLVWRGLGHRASALRASSERRSERLRTQRGARGQREGASEARVEGEKEGVSNSQPPLDVARPRLLDPLIIAGKLAMLVAGKSLLTTATLAGDSRLSCSRRGVY